MHQFMEMTSVSDIRWDPPYYLMTQAGLFWDAEVEKQIITYTGKYYFPNQDFGNISLWLYLLSLVNPFANVN